MKPMTAAQYAAHAEQKRAESEKTEIVTLKSGSVFELRRIDLGEMLQLGLIPQSVVNESLKAQKMRGAYKPPQSMELNIDGLVYKREVVSACCVMPPFNDQTARSFLKEDFEEIYEWAIGHKGVDGAEAVTRFRKGRKRGTASDRPNGKELQPASESDATH